MDRKQLLVGAGVVTGGAAAVLGRREGQRRWFCRAVTIDQPQQHVEAFCRDLGALHGAARSVERVEVDDAEWSVRWLVRGPDGRDVPVDVSFTEAPGERGTEVRVSAEYDLSAGLLRGVAATLAGDAPEQRVTEDLRRVKQVLECGEVVRVEGQPSARGPVSRRVTGVIARRLRAGGRA